MSIKIQLRMSQKEIKDICKSYDKDGDGTVDVEEFLQKMSGSKKDAIHKALVKRSGIRKQFEKYDISFGSLSLVLYTQSSASFFSR